ncbi:hypothetical protein GcM3_217002 [Golovinomyces cichoracearum]|uniref:J domain-containing protein n=1 Tax=Golovinomyces cichoracearum TaxID=62708 RepID=A0A420H816_9PEZI|nr:hypothetical protein GcM3_217002 [Golovinomyces cichoracearum]
MSTELPSKDLYKVLGVPKNATLSQIRSAHRKLVLKCHPDKIHDQSLKAAKQLEFQNVQEAYEILSDPLKRDSYDALVLQNEIGRSNPFEFEVKIPNPNTYFSKTTVKVHTYKNGDSEGFTIFREYNGSNKSSKTESSHMKSTKNGQTRREEAKHSPKGRDLQQEKKNAKERIEKEKEKKDKEKKEKERKEKEKEKIEKEKKEKERKEKEKVKIEKDRKDKKEKENREKERKEKEKKRKEKERKRDADEKLSRKTQVLKGYLDDDFNYPRPSERKLTKAHAGGAQKTPKDTTSQDHAEINTKLLRHIKSVIQVPDIPFPGIKRMKSNSKTSNFENVGRTKNAERSSTAWKSKEKHKSTESYEKRIAHAPTHPTWRNSSLKTNSSTPLPVRQKSSHVKVREPTLQRSQTNNESRKKQNKKPENTFQSHHSSNKKNYNAESSKIHSEYCTVNEYISYSHSQFSQSFYQGPNPPFSVAYYAPEPIISTQSTAPAVSSSPGIQAVDVNQVNYSQISQGISLENISYCQTYSHESVTFSSYMTPYV